jgi:hypothetical protein
MQSQLILLILNVLFVVAAGVCQAASTRSQPSLRNIKRRSYRTPTQRRARERTAQDAQTFYQRLHDAGVVKGRLVEEVIPLIHKIVQDTAHPSVSGKYASSYILANLGEDAFKEYSTARRRYKDIVAKRRYNTGQGGPAGKRRVANRARKAKEFEDMLASRGMRFEMEPKEFVEILDGETFAIPRNALAEQFYFHLLWKERRQAFPESWKDEFQQLFRMGGHAKDGLFVKSQLLDGRNNRRREKVVLAEPVVSGWSMKQARSKTTSRPKPSVGLHDALPKFQLESSSAGPSDRPEGFLKRIDPIYQDSSVSDPSSDDTETTLSSSPPPLSPIDSTGRHRYAGLRLKPVGNTAVDM